MQTMEGKQLIRRMFEFFVRLKNDRKKQAMIAAYCDEPDEPDEPEIDVEDDNADDGEPLTWAEQKNIRKELRRFQLWHALRIKVPRGFEEEF